MGERVGRRSTAAYVNKGYEPALDGIESDDDETPRLRRNTVRFLKPNNF